MKKIYLDEAATSKVKPEVIEAVMPYMTEAWYNPSSLYHTGKELNFQLKIPEDL